MRYNINDFELVKFFSYTSTIPYNKCIVDVRDDYNKLFPNILNEFKTFYAALIEEAENVTKYMKPNYWSYFSDNKTVFKIRRKKDGKIFYIGRYDWRYSLGTGVHQYDGTQFDFETMNQIGDYKDNYIENYFEEV